jgi:hypothetical protein
LNVGWVASAAIHLSLAAILILRPPLPGPAGMGGHEARSIWATFSTELSGEAEAESSRGITIVDAHSVPPQAPAAQRAADPPAPIAPGPFPARSEIHSAAFTDEVQSARVEQTGAHVRSLDSAGAGGSPRAILGERRKGGTRGHGTSLFGVPGQGSRFVYVIDRSASMGDDDKLACARRELAASLAALSAADAFEVIVYNQEARSLQGDGERHLVPANSRECMKVHARMQSVTAEGASGHGNALRAALRLCPDTLFLVTDGALPPLTDDELRRILDANVSHCRICCIQLVAEVQGRAPSANDEQGWMAKLAAASGGSYVVRPVAQGCTR